METYGAYQGRNEKSGEAKQLQVDGSGGPFCPVPGVRSVSPEGGDVSHFAAGSDVRLSVNVDACTLHVERLGEAGGVGRGSFSFPEHVYHDGDRAAKGGIAQRPVQDCAEVIFKL